MSYKRTAVAAFQEILDSGKKFKLATLQRMKGMSKVTSIQQLNQWVELVKKEGSLNHKAMELDKVLMAKFNLARESLKPVTYHDLRLWAVQMAKDIGMNNFTASRSWIDRFKHKHGIRQRKTSRFISLKEVHSREKIEESAALFKIQLSAITNLFNPKYVINTDQTGCEFQIMTNRTYSHQGEKSTLVSTKNPSKISHSYTAQYTVTLDGTLLQRVFLCMQETNDKFGPLVQAKVDSLVEEFGNVFVTCSKSGKLNKSLYRNYLTEILVPYVKDEEFLLVIDSWTGQKNLEMYDEIFTDANQLPTCTVKVIPGKCTGQCQPLDVYFYRQVKVFIKRFQNNTVLYENDREINSREDCIKIHSLIVHQLSSHIFRDMIKYAWYACGVGTNKPNFQSVGQVCFSKNNTRHNCICSKSVFIQCAVCRLYYCFECFYDYYHPKDCCK